MNAFPIRTLLAAALLIASGRLPAAQPDPAAAGDEIVLNLQAYIGVDAKNSPGNESRGAEFLRNLGSS